MENFVPVGNGFVKMQSPTKKYRQNQKQRKDNTGFKGENSEFYIDQYPCKDCKNTQKQNYHKIPRIGFLVSICSLGFIIDGSVEVGKMSSRRKHMKNHYWHIALIWAFILYICVCVIDIVTYKFKIISQYGFQEYSLVERGFMCLLFLASMIISVFMLKRSESRCFIINAGLFWVLSAVLCQLVRTPFWISLHIRGFETFAFEVNWLRQDIWFYSYCGAFIGTIVAGVGSLLRCRKKRGVNK